MSYFRAFTGASLIWLMGLQVGLRGGVLHSWMTVVMSIIAVAIVQVLAEEAGDRGRERQSSRYANRSK